MAEPELATLADETGEYVSLMMVEDGGLGLILSMKQGEKAAHVKIEETYPGIRTRLNTTANGKLSSRASLKNEYRRSSRTTVSKKTENTIGEPEELYAEIERIRERGYAIDDEERFGECEESALR